MDGIEAANLIHSRFGIPIIYLTAYADDKTLERAKMTEPFGYLIKPFRDRELHSTIEMALFRHQMGVKLREHQEWLSVMLNSIADALIATDENGYVKLMNPVAELLTGWTADEANGKLLEEVFYVELNHAESHPGSLAGELIGGRRTAGRGHAQLKSNNGSEVDIEFNVAPIRGAESNIPGMVLVFRDVTERKMLEEELRSKHEALEQYSTSLEAKVLERTRDLENSRSELKRYSESLEKTNEALKIIIQGIEEQKKEVEKKISHNLNLAVRPILDQLNSHELPETVNFLLKSLEFNLANMLSSFGFNIVKSGHLLTPRELRICEMIRSGLSSKQIAKVMGISPQTVLVHRKNIRKKLVLSKSRQNLASFLKANL